AGPTRTYGSSTRDGSRAASPLRSASRSSSRAQRRSAATTREAPPTRRRCRRDAGGTRRAPLHVPARPARRAARAAPRPPRALVGAARSARASCSLRLEAQRGRVDAVTKTGRTRPVGEHVPEVRAATRASDLVAHVSERAVLVRADRLRPDRLIEARPAGARVVLRLRAEEMLSADDAEILPGILERVVLARERPLRAALLRDVVLLRSEPALQFLKTPILFLHDRSSVRLEGSW